MYIVFDYRKRSLPAPNVRPTKVMKSSVVSEETRKKDSIMDEAITKSFIGMYQ